MHPQEERAVELLAYVKQHAGNSAGSDIELWAVLKDGCAILNEPGVSADYYEAVYATFNALFEYRTAMAANCFQRMIPSAIDWSEIISTQAEGAEEIQVSKLRFSELVIRVCGQAHKAQYRARWFWIFEEFSLRTKQLEPDQERPRHLAMRLLRLLLKHLHLVALQELQVIESQGGLKYKGK